MLNSTEKKTSSPMQTCVEPDLFADIMSEPKLIKSSLWQKHQQTFSWKNTQFFTIKSLNRVVKTFP